ncbi:CoA pyrophosphatase [Rhodobacteraceae bacterium D3-12]|nr:CoA pyrophosphatase [Rhodobacteraceae bacterium D3-12]
MKKTDPLDRILEGLRRGGDASSDFDLNPETTLPTGRTLRPAGVLVPLIVREGRAEVILTKRASGLKHHPGQIAFPGGKQEDSDANVAAAALREAHEEIGLEPSNVELLGEMLPHETVTSFTMTPVLGRVLNPFEVRPEPSEVEEVFQVPLDHLLDPARYSVQSRRWLGQRRYYYTVPFGPYYIWGATARILRRLADQMRVE